jgi:hypothetical protein
MLIVQIASIYHWKVPSGQLQLGSHFENLGSLFSGANCYIPLDAVSSDSFQRIGCLAINQPALLRATASWTTLLLLIISCLTRPCSDPYRKPGCGKEGEKICSWNGLCLLKLFRVRFQGTTGCIDGGQSLKIVVSFMWYWSTCNTKDMSSGFQHERLEPPSIYSHSYRRENYVNSPVLRVSPLIHQEFMHPEQCTYSVVLASGIGNCPYNRY